MAIYEYSIRIGIGHVGRDNRLKLGVAADILQNASWFQMDTQREVQAFFRRERAGLFLASKQLDILAMPAYGQMVTLRSWIYERNALMGKRNTVMVDEGGAVLIASAEVGAYVDLLTGAPRRVSRELLDTVETFPPHPMEVLPRRIDLPSGEGLPGQPLTVRAAHLDSYGHMNNARYMDAAMAALPDQDAPRRIRVAYQRPTHMGETLTPFVYALEDRYIVALKGREGEMRAVAEIVPGG